MKSIFEQMDGTMQGGYVLPDLVLPAEKECPISVRGQRLLRYLKELYKVLYYNLLTSGNLRSHRTDADEQAKELFYRLEKNMPKRKA